MRKVTSFENEDEEDCAPVPTFQSAFTEALGSAGWAGNGVNSEGQGEVLEIHALWNFVLSRFDWEQSVAVLIHTMVVCDDIVRHIPKLHFYRLHEPYRCTF